MTKPDNQTMKAITVKSWGGPEGLELSEVDRPVPGPTEIQVAVHAAGVNPTDWKARAAGGLGLWGDPPILGYDISGVVVATGMGVTIFKPGDEVFGMPDFPRQAGGYSEYVTAPSRRFVHKPPTISHLEAAAVPLAGLTAWQSLVDMGGVTTGTRVFIHAAAGGLGHIAVQVAKALGAYVIGTAGASNHEFVQSLGADEIIDYRSVDFTTSVDLVDVVIDPIGGDYAARSLSIIRDGGVLVSLNSPVEPGETVERNARKRNIRTGFMLVEPDRAALVQLAAMMSTGQLQPIVQTTFPLAEAAAAHRLGEAGHTVGKIVLEVVNNDQSTVLL